MAVSVVSGPYEQQLIPYGGIVCNVEGRLHFAMLDKIGHTSDCDEFICRIAGRKAGRLDLQRQWLFAYGGSIHSR
jgi:hypothetical protein